MNEVRQFMRYVIPGVVFFVELFIYILLTDYYYAKKMWDFFSNVGGGINLLLLSAGVGFIFSIIHHSLYWTFWCKYNLAVDHRKMLGQAKNDKYLELKDMYLKNDIEPNDINQKEAWRIVCKIWHTRKETSNRIKGANERAESLSDLAHGSGTVLVGALLALLIWAIFTIIVIWSPISDNKLGEFSLLYSITPSSVFMTLLLITSIILLLNIHLYNYIQTVKNAEIVTNIIIYQELKIESEKDKEPVEILVDVS